MARVGHRDDAGREPDPAAVLPAWARRLTAEGDRRWDRLPATARAGRPHLFAPADPPATRRRAGR